MTTRTPLTRTWGWWLGLLTLVAGVWFAVSPWVLGFTAVNAAFMNALIAGLLIALCGALDAFGIGHLPMRAMRVFGTIAAILGLWAILAPFALNFDGAARWDSILTGVFVFLVSAYDAWKMPSLMPATQA